MKFNNGMKIPNLAKLNGKHMKIGELLKRLNQCGGSFVADFIGLALIGLPCLYLYAIYQSTWSYIFYADKMEISLLLLAPFLIPIGVILIADVFFVCLVLEIGCRISEKASMFERGAGIFEKAEAKIRTRVGLLVSLPVVCLLCQYAYPQVLADVAPLVFQTSYNTHVSDSVEGLMNHMGETDTKIYANSNKVFFFKKPQKNDAFSFRRVGPFVEVSSSTPIVPMSVGNLFRFVRTLIPGRSATRHPVLLKQTYLSHTVDLSRCVQHVRGFPVEDFESCGEIEKGDKTLRLIKFDDNRKLVFEIENTAFLKGTGIKKARTPSEEEVKEFYKGFIMPGDAEAEAYFLRAEENKRILKMREEVESEKRKKRNFGSFGSW